MKKNGKEQLTAAAWALMQKQGIRRLRIKNICEAAGVSKVTFYYYFQNKEDIVSRILREWLNGLLAEAKNIINRDIPFTERVLELIKWKGSFVDNLSPEFVMDLYDPNCYYYQIIKETMMESQTLIETFYASGKRQGEINRDVDTHVLIHWMNTISDMISGGRFVQLFNDPNDLFKQISSLMLYGIMGNTEEKNNS